MIDFNPILEDIEPSKEEVVKVRGLADKLKDIINVDLHDTDDLELILNI